MDEKDKFVNCGIHEKAVLKEESQETGRVI